MEGLEQIMVRQQTLRACITYAKQWRTGIPLSNLPFNQRQALEALRGEFADL